MRYRKKPIVIEAIQWNGTDDTFFEILELIGKDALKDLIRCEDEFLFIKP